MARHRPALDGGGSQADGDRQRAWPWLALSILTASLTTCGGPLEHDARSRIRGINLPGPSGIPSAIQRRCDPRFDFPCPSFKLALLDIHLGWCDCCGKLSDVCVLTLFKSAPFVPQPRATQSCRQATQLSRDQGFAVEGLHPYHAIQGSLLNSCYPLSYPSRRHWLRGEVSKLTDGLIHLNLGSSRPNCSRQTKITLRYCKKGFLFFKHGL